MRLFAKNHQGTEEWKRVRKEKLLKIKRRIEEILDREHSITAKEKSWRDRLFRPLSRFCRALGIRANHITAIGFVLIAIHVWYFWTGQEFTGLVYALLAAFTDIIDGPVARFKYTEDGADDITALGTFLDHLRDYSLALSFGYFSLFYHNQFNTIELTIFTIIALIYAIMAISTFIRLRKHREFGRSAERHLHGFLLPEMQTSFWGRAQFFALILAIAVLFIGRMQDSSFLVSFSYIAFGAHIGINFRNLLEDYILG